MECIEEDTLVALAAGALGPELRGPVILHVADCEWCRVLVAELTRHPAASLGSDAETSPRELAAGHRLNDRYLLTHVMGVGAHGVVWSAVDESTAGDVAVKVLRLDDENIARRFTREAKALVHLRHPNIVHVLEGIDTPWGPALIMERLRGRSLAEHLAEGGLAHATLTGVGALIARALEVAHAAGVVHRDLKPANVFLTEDGLVKVLDFGLASFAATGLFTTVLTKEGSLVGTPAYMAPELLLGSTAASPASDMWSLGALLLEGAFGLPPFGHGPLGRILRGVVTKSGTRAGSIRRNVETGELSPIIDALLAELPEERPTAARAAKLLEAAAGAGTPPIFATAFGERRHPGESP